jgi:dihydrofolate reductase
MRKVIVSAWMTMNGVYQSPSGPDEDPEGRFVHGGWARPYFDDIAMEWVVKSVSGAGGFLLGRRTYEIFAAHWPVAPAEERVLAEPMNRLPKYVVSTSLSEPLKWQPSTLLQGDIAEAVRRLKNDDGKDLRAIGSAQLVQTLIEHELVDELQLMIDPVVVGGGKRLFRDDGSFRRLRLVDSQTTTTGAIIATYVPATGD